MSDISPEEAITQQKANCIFCRIINKEIPSQIVYEDSNFISIMDIRPATKGHLLLMPKEHYPILPIIPSDIIKEMFIVAKKLVNSVEKGTLNNNATIFIANGGVAGQQSPHFLMHIIPREEGDNLPIDPIILEASPEETNKIRIAMKSRFKPITKKVEVEEKNPINDLAEALEANPEVKKLIIEDPEKFKNYIKANPQLEALFNNINIDKLSERLRLMEERKQKVLAEVPVVEKKKDNKEGLSETKPSSLASAENKEGGANLDKISKLFK